MIPLNIPYPILLGLLFYLQRNELSRERRSSYNGYILNVHNIFDSILHFFSIVNKSSKHSRCGEEQQHKVEHIPQKKKKKPVTIQLVLRPLNSLVRSTKS